MMMMAGFGALAAALPAPTAWADPSRPAAPAGPTPAPAAPAAATGGLLFHDEFDGPAGSVPDPSKWQVSNHRTPIKNPVGFDRPQFFGQYRDSRQNVFLDGNSNLVLRATREGNRYFGGLVHGLWRGGIGPPGRPGSSSTAWLRACGPPGGCPMTILVAAAKST
ncbi:beta-1%2C3-glucanase precursor [Mycobacterium tuberculosis]|nr:beta-1%2C3-glucanase precursor [Mycobacterium tuberculosis]